MGSDGCKTFSKYLLFLGLITIVTTSQVDSYSAIMDLYEMNDEHVRVKRADVSAIRHLYVESRISNHSQEEKDAILAKHNFYRSQTNPEASNMEYMVWNEELAHLAGLWASVCYWGHGETNYSTNLGNAGQNLWLGGSKPDGIGVVRAWHDNEINNYNYTTGTCKAGKMCGHYTQVVWANSREVGCSRAWCAKLIDNEGNLGTRRNKWIESCHYYPGGNYAGSKPFKNGPSCTECNSGIAECYNNACRQCSEYTNNTAECDCRAVCNNCGTVTSDCRCDCLPGWYGSSCSDVCEDKHTNCGKSPGWPSRAYCGYHSSIPKNCPLMCGVCEPAGEEKCVTTTAPTTTQVITSQTTTPQETASQTTSSTTTEVITDLITEIETEIVTMLPSTTPSDGNVMTTSQATIEQRTMQTTTLPATQQTTMLPSTQQTTMLPATKQTTMLPTTQQTTTLPTTQQTTTLPASQQATTFPATKPTLTSSTMQQTISQSSTFQSTVKMQSQITTQRWTESVTDIETEETVLTSTKQSTTAEGKGNVALARLSREGKASVSGLVLFVILGVAVTICMKVKSSRRTERPRYV